jgi:hypothetical protein
LNGVQFPSAFGKIGYTGVSFTSNMQSSTSIIAVPNKIIISTKTVRESELNVIITENPDFFDENENSDADFNILTLFVMWEKMKEK